MSRANERARADHRELRFESPVAALVYQGQIQVLPLDPTKRGQAFEGRRPWIPVADFASLGAVALAALKSSPRMNPRA